MGFGRRLSDSSRELEGVVGGLVGAGWTNSILLPLTSEELRL